MAPSLYSRGTALMASSEMLMIVGRAMKASMMDAGQGGQAGRQVEDLLDERDQGDDADEAEDDRGDGGQDLDAAT